MSPWRRLSRKQLSSFTSSYSALIFPYEVLNTVCNCLGGFVLFFHLFLVFGLSPLHKDRDFCLSYRPPSTVLAHSRCSISIYSVSEEKKGEREGRVSEIIMES